MTDYNCNLTQINFGKPAMIADEPTGSIADCVSKIEDSQKQNNAEGSLDIERLYQAGQEISYNLYTGTIARVQKMLAKNDRFLDSFL